MGEQGFAVTNSTPTENPMETNEPMPKWDKAKQAAPNSSENRPNKSVWQIKTILPAIAMPNNVSFIFVYVSKRISYLDYWL